MDVTVNGTIKQIQTVGESGQKNIATFQVLLKTALRPEGGRIVMTSPQRVNYNQGRVYPFDKVDVSSCQSDSFQQVTTEFAGGNSLQITYNRLKDNVSLNSITITCRNWQNPIVPDIQAGYQIQILDFSFLNVIEVTSLFNLDASNYVAYPLPNDDSVTISLSNSSVQALNVLTISLRPPIQLEISTSTPACFVKYTIPNEFILPNSQNLTFRGKKMFKTLKEQYISDDVAYNELEDIKPLDHNLDVQDLPKWMIFPGCTTDGTFNVDDLMADQEIYISFIQVINPYANRTTSNFTIEVFANYTNKILSRRIMYSSLKRIEQIDLSTNDIENISLTSDNYIVQETGKYTLQFNTNSIIPGIKSGQSTYDVYGGIHIFWPKSINSQPTQDPQSVILQAGNAVITNLNIVRDLSNIYNPDCQLALCFLIQFSSDRDIDPQQLTLILDKQIRNPDSVYDAGNFTISTLMQYKGLDGQIFYKIDTLENSPSNFNAKKGAILPETIKVISTTGDTSTYANNQIFSFTFIPTHYIPSGGYMKFYIPQSFSISSQASAVALFKIQQAGLVPAKNFGLFDSINLTENSVVGRSTDKMEQGKPFEVTLAGMRNARYVIENNKLSEDQKQYFRVETYDSDNYNPQNLIDEGKGGTLDVTTLSNMSGFSVEPYNTTNGDVTQYFITWQTDIETSTGDNLFVDFPTEIGFKNNASLPNGKLYCESKTNSLNATECQFKDQKLQINLKSVVDQYGLYKVAVYGIQNAPSLRQTSQFGKVIHTTSDPGQQIEVFDKPIYVQNDFASLLQNLSGYSINQTTEEYEANAEFVITFQPTSILKTSKPTVQLSYPDTVLPIKGKDCTVVANGISSDPKDCTLNDGARMFTILNAYPENYAGPVQIKLSLRNPIDNWGTVGFKIRTSENATITVVDPTTKQSSQTTKSYLIDVIELDSLIPNLKCIAPCKECETIDGKVLQKTYCAKCWQNKPMKFLQQRTPWIKDLTGNSTCESQCDEGFTTDGDKEQHICVKCDESCATCVDNGDKGDKIKCKTCSSLYPFLYSPDERCLKSCYQGFYKINDKNCDKCDTSCQGCSGDKFNCTSCNVNAEKKVLQVDIRNQGGKTYARGTCLQTCPAGFFFNPLNETFHVCSPCQQPCATCNATADTCLSCTGKDNKTYSYKFKCYSQCPNQTAPDMSTQVCVPCPANCNKCGTNGENNCYECTPPFLLEDGLCVEECTKSGYYANKAQTQCINKTEFPNIGPVFSIISFVIVVVILMVKKLKKDTEIIPSIIAIVGIVETFSTLFQIWMCSIYKQPRYLAFTLFAIIVQYLLNAYNYWYIDTNVIHKDAQKKEKIGKKEYEKGLSDFVAKKNREKKRKIMFQKLQDQQQPKNYESINDMEPEDIEAPLLDEQFLEKNNNEDDDQQNNFEGGLSMIEMVRLKRGLQGSNRSYNKSVQVQELSDEDIEMEGGKELNGPSIQKKEDGKKEPGKLFNCFTKKEEVEKSDKEKKEYKDAEEEYQDLKKIFQDESSGYYTLKNITDKGFIKWMNTFDRTAQVIKWVSLLISFKFYRMTYSFFMGRKQFIVLYQKKKFKKHIQATTLASQFFVKVPLIIADVVAITQVPLGTQLILTVIDTLILSIFLVIMEFYEIARIDTIMRTYNVTGYKDRKSLAACESSEDSDYLSTDPSSSDDEYPDWRLQLKNVEGNNHLFKKTTLQLKINDLEKEFDKRLALSCHEFKTGTEIEEDPREVKSFPPSPRYYEDFELPDFGGYVNYGKLFDNVYADSKDPGKKDAGKEFSEMGTQAQPSDIYAALQRKGINQLNIGVEDKQGSKDLNNLYKKKGQKKKRGRKNKYYRQIDAEDDEEADQMSDGSDEDGLDGIKEEDEEDEDEKKAKLAKQKARDQEEERIRTAEEDRLKKLADEQQKLKDEEGRKRQAELDQKEAEEREKRNTINSNREKTINQSDNISELSGIMVKSNAFQSFQDQQLLNQVIQVPPTFESRRFNENDILGNLDRDDKGNVLALMNQENADQYVDKDGKPTNPRGYLVDPKTGDIINNLNGQPMFKGKDMDEKGELPAPFNIEKHNFNPHLVRGDFDFDRNGKPIIKKDPTGKLVDKKGSSVSSRGYRVDQDGNILDNYGRKKFNPGHVTNDGDLPKLFNYNGRRFDITDVIGQVDKDALGNIIPLTDQDGNLIDNLGRMINPRGYLIDEQGNVIDKEGRQIFERKHLKNDEIPKIFPFTKFNIKNVLGDFEMDPLGNPILDKDKKGNLIDRQGKRVNAKGYLIDDKGNVINKNGKVVFEFAILDQEGDIPKVFRTGLLKSDTASSLSRLMSEIGNHQPSDFDAEEQRIQEEIRRDLNRRKRGHSGNTSVDSMMEDTPANYNQQNQRFDVQRNQAAPPELEEEDDEEDEYGSQFDQFMNQTEGFGRQGPANEAYELAKKKKKKKSKKKKKKKVEMEDPSLREHLLAGAYGGVAKPKPKRQGVKYTTDIDAGLRDITSPAVFMRDQSQKKMISSISGFGGIGLNPPESQRGRRAAEQKNSTRLRSSVGRSDIGSNIGSKVGGLRKVNESTSKLLDPQQREDQLKQQQMDEIMRKKQARMAQKKKKAAMAGKFTKDADFEKMFGQDIDEFLEDSEWDIESMDKMSQFSKGSKQTIHSAAQAGKLRGLEKLYLQRLETSQLKAGMAATGQIGVTQAQGTQKKKQFRGTGEASKQAWETNSRASKAPLR